MRAAFDRGDGWAAVGLQNDDNACDDEQAASSFPCSGLACRVLGHL